MPGGNVASGFFNPRSRALGSSANASPMAMPGANTGAQPTMAQNLQQTLSQNISPEYQLFQVPKYTPQGMGALEQLTKSGLEGLPNLGNLSFEPIAQAARGQFKEDVLPQIYEAFSARAGGQRGYGSALPNATEKARAGLELGLAGQRSNFELARHRGLLSQLELGLKAPYETAFAPNTPAGPSWKEQLTQGAGNFAGDVLKLAGTQATQSFLQDPAGTIKNITSIVALFGSPQAALAAGALTTFGVALYNLFANRNG
jgi:hypothetical protein